jgi:hypothetical protein
MCRSMHNASKLMRYCFDCSLRGDQRSCVYCQSKHGTGRGRCWIHTRSQICSYWSHVLETQRGVASIGDMFEGSTTPSVNTPANCACMFSLSNISPSSIYTYCVVSVSGHVGCRARPLRISNHACGWRRNLATN